mgnify:FL=1
MNSAKKLSKGIYEYKGYRIIKFGYYPPEQSVWWEAVNKSTENADYHAHTKRKLIEIIDNKVQ